MIRIRFIFEVATSWSYTHIIGLTRQNSETYSFIRHIQAQFYHLPMLGAGASHTPVHQVDVDDSIANILLSD